MTVTDWTQRWRMQIRHTTEYEYDGAVTSSYNEARLTPASTGLQTTLESRLEVNPGARVTRYVDYFDTIVHSFDLHQPHDRLSLVATSIVETDPKLRTHWDDIEWTAINEMADVFSEQLEATRLTTCDDALSAIAASLDVSNPNTLPDQIITAINAHLTYERGFTNVATTASEAWRRKRGVCQDFAHVAVTLARAVGLPARYLSGYLHPKLEPEIGVTDLAESHAWAEFWLGEWRGVDPSHPENSIDNRYVILARGRDFSDVTPVKGIFTGASGTAPAVTVELTRLA